MHREFQDRLGNIAINIISSIGFGRYVHYASDFFLPPISISAPTPTLEQAGALSSQYKKDNKLGEVGR